MKKIAALNDLLIEQLISMYQGELLLTKKLNKIIKATTDRRLKELVEQYYLKSEDQMARIDQVLNLLYSPHRGENCEAIKVMLEEAKDLVKRSASPQIKDAAIITAMQHIIHYHIAGYGAICNYAKLSGLYHAAELMHENLEEEKRTDRRLAILAEESVNLKAQDIDMA